MNGQYNNTAVLPPLPPREESPMVIEYEAGWALALLGTFWRTNNSVVPPENRTTIHSTSTPSPMY